MTEPTNAVLQERIEQLRKNLIAHQEKTKEDLKERDEKLAIYKREIRVELKKIGDDIDDAEKVANEVNTSMKYVKEAVSEIKLMVNGFIQMINTQNEQIDKKISDQNKKTDEQNKKIDEFINSDKRRDSKKGFVISVLQVCAGILIAVLGFWAKG